MPQHLILRIEAPLMAFGGTMIDANGPTRDLPIVSMVTGLIANALGWHRGQRNLHQDLQQRIIMGARLDRSGEELRDFQTALLFEDEEGWTTRGAPEGREKSPSFSRGRSGRKQLNHIRKRYYRADAFVTIALRLEPPTSAPTLEALAAALVEPKRPLFVGRKPCLPSRPILAEPAIEAANVFEALKRTALATYPLHAEPSRKEPRYVRFILPRGEWPDAPAPVKTEGVADVRDWITDVHAGETLHDVFLIDRAVLPLLDTAVMP
jgi:CRISPR system Cascade subunit CasD